LNTNISSGNPLIRSYTDNWLTLEDTLTMVYRDLDMKAYKSGGWTPRRYFDINLNACAFSQAFAEAGKLFAALDITTFTKGYAPGVDRGEGNRNIHNKTSSGIEYTHLLQEKIGFLNIPWAHLKEPLLSELITYIRITNGGGYPSIVIPDNDKAEFFYVRNKDRTNWSEEIARALITGFKMQFQEVSRGKIQEG